jgi:hypothetical protein
LDFIYDNSGKPFALTYTNGTATPVTCYYVLNLQGDVVNLLDEDGNGVRGKMSTVMKVAYSLSHVQSAIFDGIMYYCE